ncbi:glucose-6-phosphate isomerase [Intestinibacillus massiliensis]|uniref:glucose-6-phosphate isomerase n=1 Tax=Intestinibacillus massiliensis TaxID=1871029 RepID=UPI000B35BE3A|nr:glucose-6-phosphate isomerase [Intestinibacillus massiliensis]MCB6364744.1 glucose-6-phosphate isomerase [Intestinibacillus massiliensis]
MAMELKLTGIRPFINVDEIRNISLMINMCNEWLKSKTGAGHDYLGWVNLPNDYDREEFDRIKKTAKKVQGICDVVVVIGIGGSYLGSRAAIEFVKGQYYNNKHGKDTPDVYFVGNNVSSAYLNDIIEIVGDRDFCINVISKSGRTTEPAIAFRIFKEMIEKKYGKEGAKERIIATTDREKGALKELADAEGYETFVVPDDIGGRFSVLTAVGLLPMAIAGLDIDEVMRGAQEAMKMYETNDINNNDCLQYVAMRNILYRKGINIEVLVNYEPALTMLGEWFKQLFAESEGKEHKGLFPVSANFSTDLHSVGQFIQDGTRSLFETVIWVKEPRTDAVIQADEEDIDGLNYLAGKSMQFVNRKAYEGTLMAHVDGGTANIVFEIDRADEYHFGYLVYFFEKACGLSGYLLGVNPFNQPGVEDYKKNMFALLGKPGYEERRKALEERLAKQ